MSEVSGGKQRAGEAIVCDNDASDDARPISKWEDANTISRGNERTSTSFLQAPPESGATAPCESWKTVENAFNCFRNARVLLISCRSPRADATVPVLPGHPRPDSWKSLSRKPLGKLSSRWKRSEWIQPSRGFINYSSRVSLPGRYNALDWEQLFLVWVVSQVSQDLRLYFAEISNCVEVWS